MSTLKEVLDKADRPALVQECCDLIDEEVASKKGLSGLAVKGGFAAIKKIKPGFIPEVVDNLLDEFVEKLERWYADWSASGQGTFGDYIVSRRAQVADSLLEVTDARARTTKMAAVKKLYTKLRPSAEQHVSDAMPGVGRVMNRHIG